MTTKMKTQLLVEKYLTEGKNTVKWICPKCKKQDWDYKGKAKKGKNIHKCRYCGNKVTDTLMELIRVQ